MKREDVEAILRDVLESAERAEVEPGDMSFRVEGDYLAALCRRWIAVEDAPMVRSRYDDSIPCDIEITGSTPECFANARFRIVPEQGEGSE